MSDKIFIDTNVLIYVYSQDEPVKREKAIACTRQPEVWISTQVLNETVNILRRKFYQSYPNIRVILTELTNHFKIATISTQTIHNALIIAECYQYSYFDSLMLASALEIGCDRLFTEDLQHQQVINDNLLIINPFR